jgi:uncharacterized protein (TIGR00106 family)
LIAAFSVTPLGARDPLGTGASVGAIVAECVRIVRASGLACETNAMFTNVEGPYDEVMAVIKACVDYASTEAPRVSVVVKMDVLAADPGGRLQSKVASVERHLVV